MGTRACPFLLRFNWPRGALAIPVVGIFSLLLLLVVIRADAFSSGHHFARRQPLFHVIAEEGGDVDEDEQGARHSQGEYRCLRRAGFHDGHGFVCGNDMEECIHRFDLSMW